MNIKKNNIQRRMAITDGQKYYYPGKPCRNGHASLRYTRSGACVECGRVSRENDRVALEASRAPTFVGVTPDEEVVMSNGICHSIWDVPADVWITFTGSNRAEVISKQALVRKSQFCDEIVLSPSEKVNPLSWLEKWIFS